MLESTATLRAAGPVRYVRAAFLAVWLVGWTIGEVVAVGVLAVLVAAMVPALRDLSIPTLTAAWLSGGTLPFLLLIVLVWITLWTLGGIGAATRLLRSVAGEDQLCLQAAGLEVVRRAGPFRRVRQIERSVIRRVRIRHPDGAVVADTSSGVELLAELGTIPDRRQVCDWLRQRLQLPDDTLTPGMLEAAPAPPGWEREVEADGSIRIRQRAGRKALTLWLITGTVTLGWLGFRRPGSFDAFDILPSALALAFAAASSWLTWERRSWIVRPGRLVFRRRVGPWVSEQTFEHARLLVDSSTDSDGENTSYRLIVRAADGQRTFLEVVNDDGEVLDCARWLADRTGFRTVV